MEHIYRLVDPRDQLPFYVGITNNPHTRRLQHISRPENDVKAKKIQDIRDEGLEPILEVIESLDSRDMANHREKYWIHNYESQGIVLVNSMHSQNRTNSLPELKIEPKGSILLDNDPDDEPMRLLGLPKMWWGWDGE